MLNNIQTFRLFLHRSIILIIYLTVTACTSTQLLDTRDVLNSPIPTISTESTSPGTKTISSTQVQTDISSVVPTDIIPPASLPPQEKPPAVTSTSQAITPTPLPSDYWMSLSITPTVSLNARDIYQRGIDLGRNPHAFSKIGDCQSISTFFLSYFELPGFYNLGDYVSLQESIDWFSGSYSRDSLAVKGGFNAAAILSPLRADPKQCNPDENPIACEFRLHNPSLALISLEEWWAGHPENYETYLRQIIEYSIQQGVVPILATKADNLEGNHLINQTIARLALKYDIPLWNFWLAVQSLENHGLIALDSSGKMDMFHLTHSVRYYFYNDPSATQSGWSVRNLTALQTLDAVRRGLLDEP